MEAVKKTDAENVSIQVKAKRPKFKAGSELIPVILLVSVEDVSTTMEEVEVKVSF